MHLYQIPLEWAAIQQELEMADGELTPELETRLEALLAGGADKIEAAACALQSLQRDAAACAAEAARLRARMQALENNAANLRQLMLQAVEALGGKVKTTLFTIWAQRGASVPVIRLTDGYHASDFDWRLCRRTEPQLDREAVLRLHKAGQLPQGIEVEMREGTKFLRVK